MAKKKPAKVHLTHPATGQAIETRPDLADRYRAAGWQDTKKPQPERGANK